MWLRSIEPFSCLWIVDTFMNRSGNSGDMWTVSGREWWWRERETPEIRKASSRSYEQKSLGRRMHVQSGFFGAFCLQNFLCEALVIHLFMLCPSPSPLCSSQHHSRQGICKLPLQTPLGRILGCGWQWKALARDWKVGRGENQYFQPWLCPSRCFWQVTEPRLGSQSTCNRRCSSSSYKTESCSVRRGWAPSFQKRWLEEELQHPQQHSHWVMGSQYFLFVSSSPRVVQHPAADNSSEFCS